MTVCHFPLWKSGKSIMIQIPIQFELGLIECLTYMRMYACIDVYIIHITFHSK